MRKVHLSFLPPIFLFYQKNSRISKIKEKKKTERMTNGRENIYIYIYITKKEYIYIYIYIYFSSISYFFFIHFSSFSSFFPSPSSFCFLFLFILPFLFSHVCLFLSYSYYKKDMLN